MGTELVIILALGQKYQDAQSKREKCIKSKCPHFSKQEINVYKMM